MTTTNTNPRVRQTDLPVITRRDIDRFILEGKRLRAREGDKLVRAAGRGLARLGRALAAPALAAAEATGLTRRITLARMWRREYAQVAAELGTHSERELTGDLRMNRSEIPGVAAEEADRRVAAIVRANPAYRGRRTAPAIGGLAYAGRR
jgi:hypothetical protein